MGANAQTAVPAFTAGQVLTAAQQTQINTGIPVFATSVTRDAAFGGTGEKTLAEGQFAYLEDSNTTQYYDGSAWQSVGALAFITGATFTTVASVSFASGVFTSTYSNYLVVVNFTASSVDQNVSLRVNNAGSARTANEYFGSKLSASTAAAVAATASNPATSFNMSALSNSYPASGLTMTVYQPQVSTVRTTLSYHGFGAANTGAPLSFVAGGVTYDTAESHDGLTFLVGGTMSGFYKVYGITNS